MSEQMWIDRAQSAEAKLSTMKQAHEAAVERIRNFKTNFGIREKDNGEIDVDFEVFVQRLGLENAMILRQIIDEVYQVSGEPGKKPRIKLVANVNG